MQLRLGFALFAHLDPDVYIVDETLAVGDIAFQQKCFRQFQALRDGGCGVLLVSHDLEAVSYLCDRALLWAPDHPAIITNGGAHVRPSSSRCYS